MVPKTWRSVQKSPNWWPTTRKSSSLISRSISRRLKVPIPRYNCCRRMVQVWSIIQDCADSNSPFKLKTIWGERHIALISIIRWMRTIVISKLWTLTDDMEKRIQATQIICFFKLLNFSYQENITNEDVKNRIWHGIFTVKRWKDAN